MSDYTFKLPDLAEGTVEAEVGEWFVQVGDQVAEEDVICSMMTEKAAVDVTSPVAGRVKALGGEVGTMIPVGKTLIVIETKAESEEPSHGSADFSEADAGTTAASDVSANRAGKDLIDRQLQSRHLSGNGRSAGRVITSPAIRRRAREAGIDLREVEGSGPGGRILRGDFDRARKAAEDERVSNKRPTVSAAKEVKIVGLRRVIAERMAEANRDIPTFTYVEEIDVTELERVRQSVNDERGTKLTILPFVGVALVRALGIYPQFNTTYDKERGLLLQHDAVHLGIATQTAEGLKVPVVRDTQTRSIFELDAEIKRLATGARGRTISSKDLTGSTITITSLGKLGGLVTTPIINAPEVAIIGINRATERPVVLNGRVAIRLMMNVSCSFDHRFIDGQEAAEMIQVLRQLLEQPARIFIA